MKQPPTFKQFVQRVGGFLALVLSLILLAKAYWPGYEAVASAIACGLGIAFLIAESVLKSKRSKRTRPRK